MSVSRDELVRRLAEVSRLSYVRQQSRDHAVPLEELTLEVTDHDRERAEDVVAELERLGVYRPAGGQQPTEAEPPEQETAPEPKPGRQPLTNIWGQPITKRTRRRRD